MNYEFTSESVSRAHPDKIADLISDTVANYLIDKNINHRAAVETLVTTNMVTLAGEFKSDKFDKVYIDKLVRAVEITDDIQLFSDYLPDPRSRMINDLLTQTVIKHNEPKLLKIINNERGESNVVKLHDK